MHKKEGLMGKRGFDGEMKVLGKIDSERKCFGVIANPEDCKNLSPDQKEKLSTGNASIIRVYCYINGGFQEAKCPQENTLEVIPNDRIKPAEHLSFLK